MELFGKIFKRMKDNVKYTVITPKGNRFQGNWYQDVMLDMLLNYRYNAAKIITENVIEIYEREIESEESLQMDMRIKKIIEYFWDFYGDETQLVIAKAPTSQCALYFTQNDKYYPTLLTIYITPDAIANDNKPAIVGY
jgi:hypothetical protein